jgi:hypothetical protein
LGFSSMLDGPVSAGATIIGRWAVEDILDVRRPGGKGRRLEVEVAWEGEWVNVTQLTGDLRKRVREMEGDRYGAAARQCR